MTPRRTRAWGFPLAGALLALMPLGIEFACPPAALAETAAPDLSPNRAVASPAAAVRAVLAAPARKEVFVSARQWLGAAGWQRLGQRLKSGSGTSPRARLAWAHWLLQDGQPEAALPLLRAEADASPEVVTPKRLLAEALWKLALAAQTPDRSFALGFEALSHDERLASAPRLSKLLHFARLARRLPDFVARLRELPRAQSQPVARVLVAAEVWLGAFPQAAARARAAGVAPPAGLPPLSPSAAPSDSGGRPPRAGPPGRSAEALASAAEAALAEGNETEAMQLWQRLVRLHPSHARGLVGLGRMHHRQGRKLMALEIWKRLLVTQRPAWRGRLELAGVLVDHGHHDEAGELARGLVAFPEASAQAHRLLARMAAARGRLEEALVHWLEVARLERPDGEHAEVGSHLTELAPQLGPDAREELLAQVNAQLEGATQPEARHAAFVRLAAVQSALGLTDEALATLDRARRETPTSSPVARQAVALFYATRQLNRALSWLNAFLGALPSSGDASSERVWALQELSSLHQQRSDFARAEALLTEAYETAPSPRTALQLARLQEWRQVEAEPHEAFERALQSLRPWVAQGDVSAVVMQFRMLARQGRWQRALQEALATLDENPALPLWNDVLQLCRAHGCLNNVETWLATRPFESTELDEVHVEVLEALAPALSARADAGDPSARQRLAALAETGLGPLWRHLITRSAPAPQRIALAGLLARPEIAPWLEERALAWLGVDGAAEVRDEAVARARAALWALARLAVAPRGALATAAWQASAPTRWLILLAIGRAACLAPTNAGAMAVEAVPMLEAALRSRDPLEASLGAWALGQLPASSQNARLGQLLQDPTRPAGVRATAAAVWRDERALEWLADLGRAADAALAAGALTGLAELDGDDARAALWEAALTGSPDGQALARAALRRTERQGLHSRCRLPPEPSRGALEAWLLGVQVGSRGQDVALGPLPSPEDQPLIESLILQTLDRAEPETQGPMLTAVADLYESGATTPTFTATLLKRLEDVALNGPAEARPSAVALRNAAGVPVSPLELVRAIAVAASGDGAAVTKAAHRLNEVVRTLLARAPEQAARACGLALEDVRPEGTRWLKVWLAVRLARPVAACDVARAGFSRHRHPLVRREAGGGRTGLRNVAAGYAPRRQLLTPRKSGGKSDAKNVHRPRLPRV